MLESQVFPCPILHLITNQAFLAVESCCLPAVIKRCEQGVVFRLTLFICRLCYTTSGGVLAPKILVNSYLTPPSTYLTPLRFLFFLGILGGMEFIIAVWWKMSKLLFLKRDGHHPHSSLLAGAFSWSERDEPPLVFLNPGLFFRVRTCSQSFGIPALGWQLDVTILTVTSSSNFGVCIHWSWTWTPGFLLTTDPRLHLCSSASFCRQEVEQLKWARLAHSAAEGHLCFYLVILRICVERAKCLSKSKLCFKLSLSTLIICTCGSNNLVLTFPLPLTLLTAFLGEVVKNTSVIPLGNKTIPNCFPLNLSPFLSYCVCTSYWMPVTFQKLAFFYSFQSM